MVWVYMMLKIAFDCPETFIQSQCNKLNGYMDADQGDDAFQI